VLLYTLVLIHTVRTELIGQGSEEGRSGQQSQRAIPENEARPSTYSRPSRCFSGRA